LLAARSQLPRRSLAAGWYGPNMPLSLDCEVLPAYMSPRPSFPCKLPLSSKHPNSRSQQSCADNRKHLLHAKHLELRPWHKRRLKAAVQVTEARLSRVPIPKHEELPVLSHCICMTPQNSPPAKCARQLPLRTSLPWFAQPPDRQCENKGARTSWALVGASQTGTCNSGEYLRCWRASDRCAARSALSGGINSHHVPRRRALL